MKQSTFATVIAVTCFLLLFTRTSYSAIKPKMACISNTVQAIERLSKSSVLLDTLDRHLYVLYIKVDDIKNVIRRYKKRLVLNFYVDNSNAFNLRGWVLSRNITNRFGVKFDTTSSVNFTRTSSSIKDMIDKGTFLGNVIINREKVGRIRRNKKNKTYLVLIPHFGIDSEKGQIFYQMILTNTDPKDVSAQSSDDENLDDANPTPPRNYN